MYHRAQKGQSIPQHQPPLLSAEHRRGHHPTRWLFAALCGVVLLLGVTTPALAAKPGTIHLFAASNEYTPGKPVTMYVYFYRVSSMGFWGQNIASVPDFKVRSRKRISGRTERSRDPNGSPFPIERQHLLYRVSMMPRAQSSTLRYGPLRLSFRVGSFSGFRRVQLTSNVLTFKRRKKSGAAQQIKSSIILPKGHVTEGQAFQLTYQVQCPTSLCDYQKIGHARLRQILQKRVKITPSNALSLPQPSVTPEITYQATSQPPLTTLRFRYKLFPLRKGSLQTPSWTIELPVLSTIDQRPVLRDVHNWLVSKGIKRRQVASYVQMDRDIHANLTLRNFTVHSRSIEAKASPGLQGQWQVKSKLVKLGGKTYWKVSLEGRGFLRTVISYFRQQLLDALTNQKLTTKVALAHQSWELPDGQADGRIQLHAFFRFREKAEALPPLTMRFVDASGKPYTRTAPAIPEGSATTPDNTPLRGGAIDRRLYIHHYKAPTKTQAQQVTVWGVKLPNGFPTQQVLAQRWKFTGSLNLTKQRVGQVHRSYTRTVRDPFTGGVSYMRYSGPSPVHALVGTAQVSIRTDPMAAFPAVRWGNKWIFHYTKASKANQEGLRLIASTDRKRYFSGEKVEYKLALICPKRLCNDQLRKFFDEQILQKFKLLKLPSFARFAEPKVLEHLKQHDTGQSIEFRYRIRFKAPSADFKVKAATLRLPRRFQYHILQRYQTCLFPEGGSQSLLFRLVAKDHYQKDVQNDGRCNIGTQILASAALNVPIEALPDQAKGLQLIGSFRVSAKLTQMAFPNKNTTIADKPFYLVATVAGDGDLQSARELLKDQLSRLARRLRKRSVTSFIETPSDKGAKGKLSIQMQLIGEEPGSFQLPSLKLKYYHREEGVLTAQTLPIKVTITPRRGGSAVIPVQRRSPTKGQRKRIVQKTTDLRPNRVLPAHFATQQPFSFESWYALLLLFGGPGLFFLFFGWHKVDMGRSADPQRSLRNRALRQCNTALQDAKAQFAKDPKAGARASIDALQRYLIERLSLSQKTLTASEIEEILQPHTESEKTKVATRTILEQLGKLEASLYGGDPVPGPESFLQELTNQLRELDRELPKDKGASA